MDVQLDLRHLPPPEPMQRILDALPALLPGQRLRALTPCRPAPLLPLLAERGYVCCIDDGDDGHARVTIRRCADAPPR